MASAKSYRFITANAAATHVQRTNSFELDESDVWGDLTRSNSGEFRNAPPLSSRKPTPSPTPARKCRGGDAASLPVNVPDWSKILREEYKDKGSSGEFYGGDDGGDVDREEWVAPHEYLARTRNASFSVHEGIGRTLKGRDLSRVRNAIWEKTGFQD